MANIEIIKINPQGFCKGVINAISLINNHLDNDDYEKPLYMLGGLVHNKHIINAYKEKGITIIDDYKNIKKGTIIITAHGLSPNEKEKIINQGLHIIDATCKEVEKIQKQVMQKLQEGFDVIYYGKKNHPECLAVTKINTNKIHLIEKSCDILNLKITNDKILFTNQTTMSYFDTLEIFDLVKNKYPLVKQYEDICNATKRRQLALINQGKLADVVIVVGDPTSNNTTKLKELVTDKLNIPCHLIESAEDVKKIDFKNIQNVAITAGASTPNVIVDEVIKTIQDSSYISNLSNNDYLNFLKRQN